jgi:CBS domain-containing protein
VVQDGRTVAYRLDGRKQWISNGGVARRSDGAMSKTRVCGVMSNPVHSVDPTADFQAIVAQLSDRRIGGMPVVDTDGRVLGVVSESDLLLKEERLELEDGRRVLERRAARRDRAKAGAVTAAELMSSPAITVSPDTGVAEAARLMHRHRVRRLPVVDASGALVGIVSKGDLLKVFLRSDEDIRREIVDEVIRGTLLIDPAPVTVEVHNGMVSLTGEVDRKSDVRVVGRMTQRVDGVVDVRNELTFGYDDTHPRPEPRRERDPWLSGR